MTPEEWNKLYPVGTHVHLIAENIIYEHKTFAPAFTLPSGIACVDVNEGRLRVLLSAVRPYMPPF